MKNLVLGPRLIVEICSPAGVITDDELLGLRGWKLEGKEDCENGKCLFGSHGKLNLCLVTIVASFSQLWTNKYDGLSGNCFFSRPQFDDHQQKYADIYRAAVKINGAYKYSLACIVGLFGRPGTAPTRTCNAGLDWVRTMVLRLTI